MSRRIQNFEALAENELRRDALAIAEAGYAAVDVNAVIRDKVQVVRNELRIGNKVFNIHDRNIFFVGVGKCACAAARTIEDILGDRLKGGIALDVSPLEGCVLAKIQTYIGTHPLPSEANVEATNRIMDFLAGRTESDLVIMLISGGGSTLLCSPSGSMTCIDESSLFTELTAKSASIQDINTVRKHISRARGGALATASYPAEVVALIVSDVPSNDLTSIASGPTVLDPSTVEDARAVLARYGINASSLEFLETPKDETYFSRVTNLLFLSSRDALAAMQQEAAKRGYAATIVDDRFSGEAREIGHTIVEKLHDAPAHTAYMYAGESTVTVPTNAGKGGRNQELALAALADIRDNELILPFSSDGRDNTDHAGAITDDVTRAHALAKHISAADYLDTHRSYDFFTATGDALLTGYTGSNVSDLIIALKK